MSTLLSALHERLPAHRGVSGLWATAKTTGGRTVSRAAHHIDARTTEPALAEYFTSYMTARERSAAVRDLSKRDKGLLAIGFVAAHPLQTLWAGVAMARLPKYSARLRSSPAGRAIGSTIAGRTLGVIPMSAIGVSLLEIPEKQGEYRLGASRQTLRRKIRAAEKRGITWRLVTSDEERRQLLPLVDRRESGHEDPRYRRSTFDNRDLLDHDLWLVAEAAGEPVLISVTPTDGEWASWRLFRKLSSDVHSDARYYAMAQLVDQLGARGVRYLIDGTPPTNLTNGLRHYQRMVGFRYARVGVHRT